MIQLIRERKGFAIIDLIHEFSINESQGPLNLNQLCNVFHLNSIVKYLVLAYSDAFAKEQYSQCEALKNEIIRNI